MKAERGSIGAAYVVANKPANPSSDCEMFREIMMRLTEEFPEKFSNVGGKRAAQASERRTPPNLRTSTDVYLNNTTK
jgi:hypothetical protein